MYFKLNIGCYASGTKLKTSYAADSDVATTRSSSRTLPRSTGQNLKFTDKISFDSSRSPAGYKSGKKQRVGLLTYSIYGGLPNTQRQWLKNTINKLLRSGTYSNRHCPGFAPDSLLIFAAEGRIRTVCLCKDKHFFYFATFLGCFFERRETKIKKLPHKRELNFSWSN